MAPTIIVTDDLIKITTESGVSWFIRTSLTRDEISIRLQVQDDIARIAVCPIHANTITVKKL